jgi:sigma-B regulation protein RsbU (phosphoserine phosphatase)
MTPDSTRVQPRVLVAEDHTPSRLALQALLERHGFQVTLAATGDEARAILTGFDPPPLALIDWMLPGMTGVELCRTIREGDPQHYVYFIVITARDTVEDLSVAFSAGADDFIRKPFETVELLARLKSGQRIVELEHRLARQLTEVQQALERVRQLQRLLPICMYCKRVRKDPTYWQEIDEYIHLQTGTDFSHGICPDCLATVQVGGRVGLRREID